MKNLKRNPNIICDITSNYCTDNCAFWVDEECQAWIDIKNYMQYINDNIKNLEE